MLKCGHCGCPLSGSTHRATNGTVRRYYYCFGGSRGTCSQFRVGADRIEGIVADFFKDIWLAPDAAERLRAELVLQATHKAALSPGAQEGLRNKLAKIERQIERGQQNLLLADPQDVPACQKLLATWRAERSELEASLDALSGQQMTGEHGVEQIADRAMHELRHLHKRMSGGNPATARSAFMEMFSGGISLMFHPRAGGRGRFHLARVLIQSKSQLHFTAGNRT